MFSKSNGIMVIFLATPPTSTWLCKKHSPAFSYPQKLRHWYPAAVTPFCEWAFPWGKTPIFYFELLEKAYNAKKTKEQTGYHGWERGWGRGCRGQGNNDNTRSWECEKINMKITCLNISKPTITTMGVNKEGIVLFILECIIRINVLAIQMDPIIVLTFVWQPLEDVMKFAVLTTTVMKDMENKPVKTLITRKHQMITVPMRLKDARENTTGWKTFSSEARSSL